MSIIKDFKKKAQWPTDQFIGLRKAGDNVLFEYHCFESDQSSDAELWYRSHQPVKIIAGPFYDGKPASSFSVESLGRTMIERGENGVCFYYEILFKDGFKANANEDELLDSKSQFERPDPPTKKKAQASGPKYNVGDVVYSTEASTAPIKITKIESEAGVEDGAWCYEDRISFPHRIIWSMDEDLKPVEGREYQPPKQPKFKINQQFYRPNYPDIYRIARISIDITSPDEVVYELSREGVRWGIPVTENQLMRWEQIGADHSDLGGEMVIA